MPINKGLGGFCFLKSVKDEIFCQKKPIKSLYYYNTKNDEIKRK